MIFHHLNLFGWLLPVVLVAPWVAGVVIYWLRLPRDGSLPPSQGELYTRSR